MADSFQSYKVSTNEQSSATKFNNLVQALEDAINSLDDSNVAAAAAIAVSKLAAGSNGDVLTTSAGIPVWSPSTSSPTYQTTLPGTPSNGQETILVDSTTSPTYTWRLRYNATLAKWEYLGGRAAFSEVTTASSTNSGSYAALGTPGPSITLPAAGDYRVRTGFSLSAVPGSNTDAFMSYDIGVTGAVDDDAVLCDPRIDAAALSSASRTRIKTGLSAVALTAKYRTSAGVVTVFQHRWMEVEPVLLNP